MNCSTMANIDSLRVGRKNDRRVKITEENKSAILELHKQGVATREIARRMKKVCSRRAIQFIIWPERLEIVKSQFKERRKDGRYKYGKIAWRDTMREHRAYKKKLKEENKL